MKIRVDVDVVRYLDNVIVFTPRPAPAIEPGEKEVPIETIEITVNLSQLIQYGYKITDCTTDWDGDTLVILLDTIGG